MFDRHYLKSVPTVILMPHSACNCRCIMCDIWKNNARKTSWTSEQFERLLASLINLKTRHVVLSGGEALLHPNVFEFSRKMKQVNMQITLLTTGLLLERFSDEIVRYVDDVIVSLDGSRDVHDAIRSIPGAFDQIAEGIRGIRKRNPEFNITARCVLQKTNFRDIENTVDAAQSIGLDRISFLAADVTTDAFNHAPTFGHSNIVPEATELPEFRDCIEHIITTRSGLFRSGFIAESPDKLRRLADYYRALHGLGEFPKVACNAPWNSAVIEAGGSVRPCFFHAPYGTGPTLKEIVNSANAVSFRRRLNVKTNDVCRRCVCSRYVPWYRRNS